MAPQAAESMMAQNAAAQREPSMEEILASIRRIIEDSDTPKGAEASIPQAANARPSRDIDAFREELHEEGDDAEQIVERPATVSHFPAARAGDETEQRGGFAAEAAPSGPSAVSDDDMDDDELLTASDLAVPGEHVAAPRTSIISEAAGRQVAAAFDELSEALMASRRRSFDEIAEEMIRPMLQEWLDNNLPTLVERLVREEIERVARGQAR